MNQRWFWTALLCGTAIRFFLMPTMSSHYTDDLFLPFLDHSLLNPGPNPWRFQAPEAFPYGGTLFIIEILPKALGYWVFGSAALGNGPLSLVLFKLPIFIADLLLFLVLLRKFAGEDLRLVGFYWFNPIIIYVNYVLGQLDIIPMALIIFSCIALLDKQLIVSAAFAAAALTSKFHTALAIPLLLLYIWRNDFFPFVISKICLWLITAGTLVAAGFLLPFQANRLGYVTLASPEALRLFSLAVDLGGGVKLYLGFAFVLAVLGRLLVSKQLSGQGLYFGLGIAFTSLVLVTHPMPSWFLWFMPFLAVFISQYRLIPVGLPLLFVFLYFAHFSWISSNLELSPFLGSISLTLLQSSVAAFFALMWFLLRKQEYPISGRLRPMVIGIAGDSGAGKNRLSEALARVFDVRQASLVEGDDYHRWERGDQSWQKLTHLSPKANLLDTLSNHAFALSSGRSILHPQYDHGSGRFTLPRRAKPNQTIIIQGLHTLYPKSMRNTMDLKVFIRPNPLIRLSWKIQRDVLERGYMLDKVMKTLKQRESDSLRFIEPQKVFADWIIEALPDEELTERMVLEGYQPRLKMRHILWNDASVGCLIEVLSKADHLDVNFQLLEDDIDRVAVTISGHISSSEVERAAKEIFPYLRSLTRSPIKPNWLPDFDGVNQLIALCLTNQKNYQGIRI